MRGEDRALQYVVFLHGTDGDDVVQPRKLPWAVGPSGDPGEVGQGETPQQALLHLVRILEPIRGKAFGREVTPERPSTGAGRPAGATVPEPG